MSEITKSIWIDAAPEVVFEYFTDAERMALWCGEHVEIDPRPGGVYRVDLGRAGRMEGRFVRVEAPLRVVFEVGSADEPDGPVSLIEVSIRPEAGGSRVEVRQTGLEGPGETAASHGWDHHLARLSVAATGGSPEADSLCRRTMESLGATGPRTPRPESEEAATLARGWIEAWQRFDLEWLRQKLSADFVHVSPFGRFDDRETYLAAVEPMARQSVAELTIRDVVVSGDRAVVRFDNRTEAAVVPSCDWVRAEGGVIREIRSFYDTVGVREVLSDDEQRSLDGSTP